jgi:hypothetical protein
MLMVGWIVHCGPRGFGEVGLFAVRFGKTPDNVPVCRAATHGKVNFHIYTYYIKIIKQD